MKSLTDKWSLSECYIGRIETTTIHVVQLPSPPIPTIRCDTALTTTTADSSDGARLELAVDVKLGFSTDKLEGACTEPEKVDACRSDYHRLVHWTTGRKDDQQPTGITTE